MNSNSAETLFAMLSTIGTPPYGISKYLVKRIQQKLSKSQHKVKNSVEFELSSFSYYVKTRQSYYLTVIREYIN